MDPWMSRSGAAPSRGIRRYREAQINPAFRDMAKPIRLGPALMTYLDAAKRREFFRQWQQGAAGG